jgi:hypothetical protein
MFYPNVAEGVRMRYRLKGRRDLFTSFHVTRVTLFCMVIICIFLGFYVFSLQVMFSGPLPEFSSRLNAWATALTCQWLMGPCQVNDVQHADGKVRVFVLYLFHVLFNTMPVHFV